MVFHILDLSVLDRRPLLEHRNVFHCFCICLRRCLLWRAKVPVAVAFTQGGGTLIFIADRFLLGTANFPAVLLCKDLHGFLPRLFAALAVVLQELVLLEADQIHLAN